MHFKNSVLAVCDSGQIHVMNWVINIRDEQKATKLFAASAAISSSGRALLRKISYHTPLYSPDFM
jgi:hypothetical protein